MESPPASATVCSVCGEPLNAKGGCVACLLRGGLDEGAQENASPPSSLVFGDFEIARRADGSLWELGRGAMGVTYRAVDKVLHRNVALKVIETPSAAGGSQAVRERFLREARAAAALRHPNVAGVFHLSASPEVERCYFAMELVEGETLEARVRRDGPLKVELALEIAIQVTRALMAAAARGLIHRDLKPGNIMLARGDAGELEVKVIDFGLAKAAAEAAGEMDLTHGGFVGTPAFASPEQFESGAVDVRSDIYALGATLWFALTGRAPFSATTVEEMRVSRTRTPLPIEQLIARKVPPALIALLRSCLAIDPAERPASARELMEALESCRRSLGEADGRGPRGFFHQLKQRNVVRVALAYGVTAWLLAQIATRIFPFFEVPNWGVRLVILVLCLGFPVALMLAWAFQITPEGIVRLEGAIPNESTTRGKSYKFTAFIAGIALAAVALFAFQFSRQNMIPAEPDKSAASVPNALREKSIAVLPFENLSKDEENAFFAGGVQDEILTNLAKIADLKVISRTSVMNYKSGAGRNLREIAKTLEVSHVVEGSVQRAGGRIRVTAQLIDARTDNHLWAEHYDRDLADVFAIQSEIAQQIADQLRAKLSPQEKVAIDERPTADLNAYALFSEARAIEVWADQPQKNLARKIQLLERAIERDPKFVLAWCELAKLQTDLGGFENRQAHWAAAKKAAETAVQLRPDLGQPHVALAYYYNANSAERERAYEELSIARRTLPNDALLFRILSALDMRRNRWDDSLAEIRKAYELDPLNDESQYHLSSCYRLMRLYAEREKFENELAAKEGKNEWSYLAYAENRLDAGDPAAAQSFLAKVPDTFSPTAEIWETRFNAALYLHDYDAASRVLATIPAKMAEEMFEGQRPQSWADGLIARARGDQQKAQAIYSAIREKMTTKWAGLPKKDLDLAKAASLDAGLGRKEEAIGEARRAVELRPIGKDSFYGPELVRTLALVYAWTGEQALAIEQLEIIAKIPAGPSYGELRFDPTWDSLRGDPGFEKIVASLAPKQL